MMLSMGATEAQAAIYKYRNAKGQVVYTDSLAQLPKARRAHYNRQHEEQRRKRQALEAELGKEEVRRREAEAEREALARKNIAEAERRKRLAEIDAVLSQLRVSREKRVKEKELWQSKMREAKAEMTKLLKEFKKTQEEYNGLATKADFALFPGQRKQKTDAKKKLVELEQKLDQAIEKVEITIPEAARKAGVPPGWLR